MAAAFAVDQGNAVMRKPHLSGFSTPQQLTLTLTV